MHITVVQRDEGFASLEGEWNELLSASRQDSPYLRHERLYLWWQAFGARCHLHVLLCRDDAGALLGVLPAYWDARGPALWARALRLLGDARAGSIGLGPFARADIEGAVFDAFAAHLRTEGDWEMLDFRFVDADSPFFGRELAMARGSQEVRRDVHASLVVELPADFESYLMDVLTAKKREALRRCRKRTAAAGATIEIVEHEHLLEPALDDVFRLYEERMDVVAGPGFSVTREYREFVSRLTASQLRQGQLRLGFMVVAGHRVAFAQLFRYGDTLYAVRSGFAAEWGRLEVLKALNSHMIERAIAEGCTHLDFGLGDQEYKQGWGVAAVRRFSDVRVYSGSTASRLRRARGAFTDWGVDTVLSAPEGVRVPLLSAGRHARRLLRGGGAN